LLKLYINLLKLYINLVEVIYITFAEEISGTIEFLK